MIWRIDGSGETEKEEVDDVDVATAAGGGVKMGGACCGGTGAGVAMTSGSGIAGRNIKFFESSSTSSSLPL